MLHVHYWTPPVRNRTTMVTESGDKLGNDNKLV
jgi:hypothetical protein